uniref:Terminase n=1 Tax=viral metagenome TaxID=1070528 RepID=A0A6M3L6J6_9ZZZZ
MEKKSLTKGYKKTSRIKTHRRAAGVMSRPHDMMGPYKKPGQPTKFSDKIHKQMKSLYLLGLTDVQVALGIGVCEDTIHNWKKSHPKFFESLKDWKNESDLKVEKALRQRALGYEYDEVTYETSKTKVDFGVKLCEGEITEIKTNPSSKTKIVTKQVVPDVTAQIFWLKNRKPDEWRDKQEHDLRIEPVTLIIEKTYENGKD